MAEDRTPRVVSLTRPLDELLQTDHHREFGDDSQEHGQTRRGKVSEGTVDREPESGTRPDDTHPPSLA